MEKQEKESFDQQPKRRDALGSLFEAATFGKHFDTMKGLTHLIIRFFANFSICILHIGMGSRSFSLITIMFGVGVIELIGSIASFQNRLSMFLGPGIDFSLFHLHGRIFLIAGIIQSIWILYRDHVLKQECYTYSLGKPILFPLWEKLITKTNLPILRTSFDFASYVEPALIIGLGYLYSNQLGLQYGGFLIWVGCCQFGLYHIMRTNFNQRVYDLIDAKIVNQEFLNAMEQKKQGGEKQSQPDRGFGLFNSHVMLNQMQNVMDSKQEIDPELAELQEQQSL